MNYRFDSFELDAARVELRQDGAAIAIEPQVFALLLLLIENADRMVSKDEIIEKIWDGRIVSESALTSRVKSARQALGDDGKAQKFIRTLHGKGFRFIAEVKAAGAERIETPADGEAAPGPHGDGAAKPSIAVLPFRLVGVAGPYAPIADALPHELISELSRLRWLFVIARGSTFRFRGPDPDVIDIGRALSVRYCLSGMIEVAGARIIVTVELSDTRDGGIVWAERYAATMDNIYDIRTQIVSSIVSALEIQIPLHEAQRAKLVAPQNLDAWSAYHLGLTHLHRFNAKDNEAATAMFERALSLDSGFARAHAGLSSSKFQDAFLRYKDDVDGARMAARRHAEHAVEIDPLDPYGNFALGRVHWIENNIDGGMGWLERSVQLSPNYAHGVYARSWADAVMGRADVSRENVDLALALSPLDPFRYGMLGVRAFTYLTDGDDAQAAHWAEQAARTPGAHVLIAMIAVAAHAANGDHENAARWAANVRARRPSVSQKEFFTSFPFSHEETRRRASKALTQYGF